MHNNNIVCTTMRAHTINLRVYPERSSNACHTSDKRSHYSVIDHKAILQLGSIICLYITADSIFILSAVHKNT